MCLAPQNYLKKYHLYNLTFIGQHKPYLTLSFVLFLLVVQAQQTYFQQEVNYKINVRLNDNDHTLKATEEIQYINNSDKGLDYIYFHLWPNAYRNNSTALAKQLLQQKKTTLYYSKPEERGYIDSLDFMVIGKTEKIEHENENPDICKLI